MNTTSILEFERTINSNNQKMQRLGGSHKTSDCEREKGAQERSATITQTV